MMPISNVHQLDIDHTKSAADSQSHFNALQTSQNYSEPRDRPDSPLEASFLVFAKTKPESTHASLFAPILYSYPNLSLLPFLISFWQHPDTNIPAAKAQRKYLSGKELPAGRLFMISTLGLFQLDTDPTKSDASPQSDFNVIETPQNYTDI
jgi:hypothetical protein